MWPQANAEAAVGHAGVSPAVRGAFLLSPFLLSALQGLLSQPHFPMSHDPNGPLKELSCLRPSLTETAKRLAGLEDFPAPLDDEVLVSSTSVAHPCPQPVCLV